MSRYWTSRRVRSWLRRDAVILDTETTDLDGVAIEVAVIDLRTGTTLLDTLIHTDIPISDEAAAVHGIHAEELVDAPDFAQLSHELRATLSGRPVLAYNAPFDQAVLHRTARHHGVAEVAADRQWSCVMRTRSRYENGARWRRLNSAHRAVGDCQKTREILLAIAAGAPTAHI